MSEYYIITANDLARGYFFIMGKKYNVISVPGKIIRRES